MENGVNFESFSKAKYKEGTKYQRTNVVELRIFSVKSTLLAVLRPFQTSDRVRNTFKFCQFKSVSMLHADTSSPDAY